MKEYQYYIGIDIGKEKSDVVFHEKKGGKDGIIAMKSTSIAAFIEKNRATLQQALVVLEATGGYEGGLLLALIQAGVAVHRVAPLQSKHYRCSVQLRGKTDRQDALTLARYAAERHASLRLFTASDKIQIRLQQLTSRRDDMVRMQTAEKNRFQHPNYAETQEYVQAFLDLYETKLALIEKDINALIESCATLKAKKACLESIEGIGEKTAMMLLGHLPELGTLDKKQIASLAGLAPHPRESGKTVGYRHTGGGRSKVRCALFMAAMGARNKKNSDLRAFYEQLVARGKKKIVAMVAVMRKLVVMANAKIRDLLYPRPKNIAQHTPNPQEICHATI